MPASTPVVPIVPKPSPPFIIDLVNSSPTVAPSGRVATNATQKIGTREHSVKSDIVVPAVDVARITDQ